MNSKIRNMILASALATGLIGGGAIASAQTAVTTTASASASSDTSSASASSAPAADQGPRGPQGGADRSARDQELATALNISVDQVTAAEQAAHDAVDAQLGTPTKPSGTPTDADKAAMQARHDLFEQTFAEQLGVTTDQLTAARVSAAQTHLASEVVSGKITQAQADEMLTRIQNGDLRGPGGPGGQGGPRGQHQDRSARDQELATALNISVEQVTAAQQAAHDAVDAQLGEPTKPSGTPTEEDKAAMQARHDLFDQLFAEQLGITTDQLTAARVSAAQTHLAAEVASGKITQAQADEKLTHIQNGDLPGPGGPGHDGPPPAADASAAPTAG